MQFLFMSDLHIIIHLKFSEGKMFEHMQILSLSQVARLFLILIKLDFENDEVIMIKVDSWFYRQYDEKYSMQNTTIISTRKKQDT